jgi:hypothetical protein
MLDNFVGWEIGRLAEDPIHEYMDYISYILLFRK